MQTRPIPRFLELDLLRTLAVIMMIVYHAAFDLAAYFQFALDPWSGGWWLLSRATVTLFLLLVGISFVISWERRAEASTFMQCGLHAWKRAGQLLLIAISISAVTYVIDPETFVRFGALHAIAVSIALLPMLRRLREWNALLGGAIILFGHSVTGFTVHTSLLLPLGLKPPAFTSVDYLPLLPWFGVVLLGLALGDALYVRFKRAPHPQPRIFFTLVWPGRHALAIYLIHQPILLTLFAALTRLA
ncbi:MAG: heparan-alpha-glucosaminide N-acetyltransferase [Candidatus Peribacteraceae bacterium]|nr:heparan-alpha-glucosaminide N-acetyltransferase [Candidatus Peribacteraceae bacterium]